MSTCKLNLKVIPGASKSEIVGWLGESLKVKVTAPPEKGKANKDVETLLCSRLNLPKKSVEIVTGMTSRQKVAAIEGLTLRKVRQLLKVL